MAPEIWRAIDKIFKKCKKKKKKKKKKKIIPGDIIILDMYTKNYDQMMYGSWDRGCDWQTDGWTEKVTCGGGWPT